MLFFTRSIGIIRIDCGFLILETLFYIVCSRAYAKLYGVKEKAVGCAKQNIYLLLKGHLVEKPW